MAEKSGLPSGYGSLHSLQCQHFVSLDCRKRLLPHAMHSLIIRDSRFQVRSWPAIVTIMTVLLMERLRTFSRTPPRQGVQSSRTAGE